MRIGVASGHSRNTDIPQRLFEWERCTEAESVLGQLLATAGHVVVQPDDQVYDLENGPALESKILCFNDAVVDLALELHLNGGGGDYSTAIYWDHGGGGHSGAGKRIAEDVCGQFQAGLPWKTIGAKPQSYFHRSLTFLNDSRMSTVFIEPAFEDNDVQHSGQHRRPDRCSTQPWYSPAFRHTP